jgi:TPR repeat protein
LNGDGVAIDKCEAIKWYTLAAEAGDAMAQHNLGSCYAKASKLINLRQSSGTHARLRLQMIRRNATLASAMKTAMVLLLINVRQKSGILLELRQGTCMHSLRLVSTMLRAKVSLST